MDILRAGIIQDELRTPKQLPQMIDFIKQGGVFTAETIAQYEGIDPHEELPIEVARFPDGEYYIHNGHHRVCALYLAGRYILTPDEYYIKEWDYSDYNDIVFLNEDGSWRGYVTPFDIKTETRVAQLGPFKESVKHIYHQSGETAALQYILKGGHLFKGPKNYFSVGSLALATVNKILAEVGEQYES